MSEIGHRVANRRLALSLTQAELAQKAGVGKRTLERLEKGESTQLATFIRVLRELGLAALLDTLLPQTEPGPIELLERKGKTRKRASGKRRQKAPKEWTWGDGQ